LPEGEDAAFSMDPALDDGDAAPVLSAPPLLLLLALVLVADADPDALVGTLVAVHESASYSPTHTTRSRDGRV
jgi:hypothetical protein